MMSGLRRRTRAAGDVLVRWLAWRLSRRLVMWCGYRIVAEATSGDRPIDARYLLAMDAMKRWGG